MATKLHIPTAPFRPGDKPDFTTIKLPRAGELERPDPHIHANDTRDAVARLEMLVALAGFEIPLWFIRRQIASAIHVIVQAQRLSGGRRCVTQISEITGVQGETVSMHDIFVFEQTGVDDQGAAVGEFHATGIQPKCLPRLKAAGAQLSPKIFERRVMTADRLDELSHARPRK